MRILLAEDDRNISTIATLVLEKVGGHSVTLAEDGEAALATALRGEVEVILLDEMMPKLSGLNVCRLYLEQCPSPVPIIFLSAKSQASDIREFTELAAGFISKPFDPMQLCTQIESILARGPKVSA